MIRSLTDARLLSSAALIVPSLAVLAPLGLAPALALLALALLTLTLLTPPPPGGERSLRHRLSPRLRPLAVLLVLIGAWGALSASWSTIPGHSLFEAGRFVLLSAAGLITVSAGLSLDKAGGDQVARAALIGVGVGLAVAAIERIADFPLHRLLTGSLDREFLVTQLDRGAVVLALVIWVPVLALLQQHRWRAATIVLAIGFAMLTQLAALGALLGLGAAAVVFAVAWGLPKFTATAFAIAFIALSVAAPLLPPDRAGLIWLATEVPHLKISGFHRLIIYRFAGDRIAERPWLGWGMDASRELPGGKIEARDYFALTQGSPVPYFRGSTMPLHPHDAVLQWRLELGVPGLILGVAVVVWVILGSAVSRRRSRVSRAGALAIVTAAMPPLLLNFGVWQAWWQSVLWLVAALATASLSGPTAETVVDGGATDRSV